MDAQIKEYKYIIEKRLCIQSYRKDGPNVLIGIDTLQLRRVPTP